MPFLTSLLVHNPRPRYPHPRLDVQLVGERVLLRLGEPEDWRCWRAVREASRDFLTPWEPLWPQNALSYDFFCGQLKRHRREWREGKGYSFQICLLPHRDVGTGKEPVKKAGEASEVLWEFPASASRLPVIGGIALTEVIRGIAQKGTLGYWIGLPYVDQGLMTEAASLVCRFAFEELKLHRLEAACLPSNTPSRRLLETLGFTEEGLAASYLKINGAWEDHILWGKVGE